MEHFLRHIVKAYTAGAERPLLPQTVFVFPNLRARTFFEYELRQRGVEEDGMPVLMAMRPFTETLSPFTEGSRLDRLMTLYNCYRRLSPEAGDFDTFRFWGEMLLDDFDDVDSNLADAESLFSNVKDFKEIASNYLTPEQLAVINRFWPVGDGLKGDAADGAAPGAARFWKHLGKGRRATAKFRRLWEILLPLYKAYNKELEKSHTASPGRILRLAAERLGAGEAATRYRRHVFVGFADLSIAELSIMETLRDAGLADFYWERAREPFAEAAGSAARLIERYAEAFPSRYPAVDDGEGDPLPEITITSVASAIGQARVAAGRIARWVEDKTIRDASNAVNTAVVTGDEGLFLPIVQDMPDAITTINVTMGVPLRSTPVAALVSTLVGLQMHSRRRGGRTSFFNRDVRRLATSPLLTSLFPEECARMLEWMKRERKYMIGLSDLPEGPFRELFPDNVAGLNDAFRWMHGVMDTLLSRMPRDGFAIERLFVNGWDAELSHVHTALKSHGIETDPVTMLRMIEHTVGSKTLRFNGEPVRGLQLMGLLETRSLDFENLIVTSLNEGTLPSRGRRGSFIPEALRRAYGLRPSDRDEDMRCWYFFRLLSKSRRALLLYDSRTGGLARGEMSRLAARLLYIDHPGLVVKHTFAGMAPFTPDPREITVEKDATVMERLAAFMLQPGEGGRNLSASALNDYIGCGLKFWLKDVLRLKLDEESEDYIDTSTYGNIVHTGAEMVYRSLQAQKDAEVVVTRDMLEPFLREDSVRLDDIVTRAMNYCLGNYGRLGWENVADDELTRPLRGEARILAVPIRRFLRELLRHDSDMTPFVFVGAEVNETLRFRMDDGREVNMTMFIDRVDRVIGDNPRLRFIDYKTGGDKTTFSSVAALFDGKRHGREKAVFQLLLYCHLHNLAHATDEPIQPYIYKLKTIFREGLKPISYSRRSLEDYRPLEDEFKQCLQQLLSEIFDPEVPFIQAATDEACRYCGFKTVCRR